MGTMFTASSLKFNRGMLLYPVFEIIIHSICKPVCQVLGYFHQILISLFMVSHTFDG